MVIGFVALLILRLSSSIANWFPSHSTFSHRNYNSKREAFHVDQCHSNCSCPLFLFWFLISPTSTSHPVFTQGSSVIKPKMQFEVLAKCHTTRARVSRMKLARWLSSFLLSIEALYSLMSTDSVFPFVSFE